MIIISCLRHSRNNSFTVFQETIPLQLFIQKKEKNSMQSLNIIVFALVSLIEAYSFSTILAFI